MQRKNLLAEHANSNPKQRRELDQHPALGRYYTPVARDSEKIGSTSTRTIPYLKFTDLHTIPTRAKASPERAASAYGVLGILGLLAATIEFTGGQRGSIIQSSEEISRPVLIHRKGFGIPRRRYVHHTVRL